MVQHNLGRLHHHMRERIYKNKEKYPPHDYYKTTLDRLIYVVGVLTPLFTLPQLARIWLNKSAADVSFLTWGSFFVFAVIWLLYGLVHQEKPIIFLNSSLVVINGLVVLGIFLF